MLPVPDKLQIHEWKVMRTQLKILVVGYFAKCCWIWNMVFGLEHGTWCGLDGCNARVSKSMARCKLVLTCANPMQCKGVQNHGWAQTRVLVAKLRPAELLCSQHCHHPPTASTTTNTSTQSYQQSYH